MREVLSRPTPLKREKRKKAFARFIWAIVILVVLYVGVGLLSHLPRVSINEVETRGLKALDSHEVSGSILSYLGGNTALVYSRANIFIFSKNNVMEFVLGKYPRIYRVNMIERNSQKLVLDIEERQAAYVWCGHEAPAYSDRFIKKDCYFVDQKGFVFDNSPYFTDGVYMAIYGGLDPAAPIIGQTIDLTNSIEDIKAIARRLDDSVTPIHSLILRGDGQHEFLLDIWSNTGNFAKILWNEDVTLEETFQKINATIGEETFQAEFDKNAGTLEYIDTRFRNRVFYKFKTPELKDVAQ